METPATFDWVEERAKCEPPGIVDELFAVIRENVSKRNEQLQCRFFVITPLGIRRIRVSGGGDPAVEFDWHGDSLVVTDINSETRVVTPILTASGERKWRVGDREVYPWQLAREFLEPLLFQPGVAAASV